MLMVIYCVNKMLINTSYLKLNILKYKSQNKITCRTNRTINRINKMIN